MHKILVSSISLTMARWFRNSPSTQKALHINSTSTCTTSKRENHLNDSLRYPILFMLCSKKTKEKPRHLVCPWSYKKDLIKLTHQVLKSHLISQYCFGNAVEPKGHIICLLNEMSTGNNRAYSQNITKKNLCFKPLLHMN